MILLVSLVNLVGAITIWVQRLVISHLICLIIEFIEIREVIPVSKFKGFGRIGEIRGNCRWRNIVFIRNDRFSIHDNSLWVWKEAGTQKSIRRLSQFRGLSSKLESDNDHNNGHNDFTDDATPVPSVHDKPLSCVCSKSCAHSTASY